MYMSKKMLTVYICSPYTPKGWHKLPLVSSLVKILRERAVSKFSAKLIEKRPDVALYGPITQSARLEKFMSSPTTDFSYWKNIDLHWISKSDVVLVLTLPGWKESKGVQAEIRYAKKHKIPVKYNQL